ncbi:MAG: hypothetical protein WAU81_03290 [Candidatus Aminicenantales bacterium]
MTLHRGSLNDYFTAPLCPSAIIQLSSTYVSGLHVDVKERQVKRHFVLDLPGKLIEPHFDRPNLADAAALAGILKDGLNELHVSGKKVACLVPEACLKIFVLAFDSLPASEREREKLIRWRAKKQMPVLPEDVRLSYEARPSSSSIKVLAALARTPVIKEYEDLFAGLGLEVGILTVPTLSLLNLLDWEKESDLLTVNIEDDSLGLAAVTRAEPALYRLKMFAVERGNIQDFTRKVETIVKEIENTAHFIEDREKREIRSLWFRSGLKESRKDIQEALRAGLPFDVHPVPVPDSFGLASEISHFMAPLVGQIPWRRDHASGQKRKS